jgi:hypothetical protein
MVSKKTVYLLIAPNITITNCTNNKYNNNNINNNRALGAHIHNKVLKMIINNNN